MMYRTFLRVLVKWVAVECERINSNFAFVAELLGGDGTGPPQETRSWKWLSCSAFLFFCTTLYSV